MEFYHFLEADFLSRTVPIARNRPYWALRTYLLNERVRQPMESTDEIKQAPRASCCAQGQVAG